MHIYQMDSHGADGGALQCIWLVVTCETMMTRLYTVPHCSGSDAVIRIAKLTWVKCKAILGFVHTREAIYCFSQRQSTLNSVQKMQMLRLCKDQSNAQNTK